MRRLLLLLLLPVFAGCYNNPSVAKETTTNPDIPVYLLFTKNGVNVYAFDCGGNRVYFTTPARDVAWTEHVGKHTEIRQTVESQ